MSSIGDSITQELDMLAFFGACDTRLVADLVVREMREGCHIHQETRKVGTPLQRLKNALETVRSSFPTPVAFSGCVRDAMQAVVSSMVTHHLDARQVTTGAVLGVLRVARECDLPEEAALSQVSHTLIDCANEAGGDVTAIARGLVEGAMEDARIRRRSVASATSAAVRTVAESMSHCDRDAVEGIARGMTPFVRFETDHLVVAAPPPRPALAMPDQREGLSMER